MVLREAIAFFLNACELEKNLSPRTLIAYSSDLEQFQSFLRVCSVDEPGLVTSHILHGFVSELRTGRQLADSSIRRKVAVVRKFFKVLEQRDLIAANPFRKANFSFR
jgi:site-specific recombinase XerD